MISELEIVLGYPLLNSIRSGSDEPPVRHRRLGYHKKDSTFVVTTKPYVLGSISVEAGEVLEIVPSDFNNKDRTKVKRWNNNLQIMWIPSDCYREISIPEAKEILYGE